MKLVGQSTSQRIISYEKSSIQKEGIKQARNKKRSAHTWINAVKFGDPNVVLLIGHGIYTYFKLQIRHWYKPQLHHNKGREITTTLLPWNCRPKIKCINHISTISYCPIEWNNRLLHTIICQVHYFSPRLAYSITNKLTMMRSAQTQPQSLNLPENSGDN